MATYQPAPDTIAARALEAIERVQRQLPAGTWVPNMQICKAIGAKPNAMVPALARAVEAGLVEKSTEGKGFMQWRLAVIRTRRQPVKESEPKHPTFSIPNWPPGFVPRFETVVVPQYEERRK